MLILTRKPGEKITITVPTSAKAATVTVKVVEIVSRNRVRLGLEGPDEVRFHRSEAADKKSAA